MPDGKTGADAFAVIRDAMKDKDRIAVARIVLSNREHMIAIAPLGQGIARNHAALPLRNPRRELGHIPGQQYVPSPHISKEMVELVRSYSRQPRRHDFDPPTNSGIVYETALKMLGEAQGRRQEHRGMPEREEKPDNVINLMDALKQSLKGGKGSAKRGRHAPTRRAAPRRTARKAHRSAARARKAG